MQLLEDTDVVEDVGIVRLPQPPDVDVGELPAVICDGLQDHWEVPLLVDVERCLWSGSQTGTWVPSITLAFGEAQQNWK